MASVAVHRLCALLAAAVFVVILVRGTQPAPAATAPSISGAAIDCLVILGFSGFVSAAVMTSPDWHEPATFFVDGGWPSLRSLAVGTPVLVLGQVVLGAGFRNGLIGIAPHVIGAMVISIFLLMVGTFAIVQAPATRNLRRSAFALVLITLAQLLLGIVAYMARLNSVTAEAAASPLNYGTTAHISTGALAMAVSVALALQVVRAARSESDSAPVVNR